MRTAIGVQECAETALNRRRFVRSADGHLGRWELAILLPTPHDACCCHVRALSGSGQTPRVSDGRAQEKTCTDAQDRSHLAIARGRSRRRTEGGGNGAGGSRRENREICGRCGCPCRDPRADKAVAPSSSSEAGRKIVRPLRVEPRLSTIRPLAFRLGRKSCLPFPCIVIAGCQSLNLSRVSRVMKRRCSLGVRAVKCL